jgi:hypothetical protein
MSCDALHKRENFNLTCTRNGCTSKAEIQQVASDANDALSAMKRFEMKHPARGTRYSNKINSIQLALSATRAGFLLPDDAKNLFN